MATPRGTGGIPPRQVPYRPPRRAALAPGGGNTLRARLAILFGQAGAGGGIASGLFLYSGAPPALGNLLASLYSGTHTKDNVGNTISPGFNIGQWSAAGVPLNHIGFDIHGDMFVADLAGDNRFEIEGQLAAAAWGYPAGGKTGGGAAVYALATDTETDSVGNQAQAGYAGPVAALKPGSNPATIETWRTLGAIAATGYTANRGRYRMTAEGEVELDVILTANSGGGTAGTYAFGTAMTADYHPAIARHYPMGHDATMVAGANFPCLLITTGGVVSVQIAALPAGTIQGINVRMPLD